MKENKAVNECSTHGNEKIQLQLKVLQGRDNLEDLGVDGRIKLKCPSGGEKTG